MVSQHLGGFLARAEERDRTLPRFARREFDAFLRCGVLAHGFCRVHCARCGKDELVAFSCKRRGFCPSCGQHERRVRHDVRQRPGTHRVLWGHRVKGPDPL